jgi:hypothetical protein
MTALPEKSAAFQTERLPRLTFLDTRSLTASLLVPPCLAFNPEYFHLESTVLERMVAFQIPFALRSDGSRSGFLYHSGLP